MSVYLINRYSIYEMTCLLLKLNRKLMQIKKLSPCHLSPGTVAQWLEHLTSDLKVAAQTFVIKLE